MSLDGYLSAGYTPAPKTVNITFEPNSPCIAYLTTLQNAQRSNRRPYEIGLTVYIRATRCYEVFQSRLPAERHPDERRRQDFAADELFLCLREH